MSNCQPGICRNPLHDHPFDRTPTMTPKTDSVAVLRERQINELVKLADDVWHQRIEQEDIRGLVALILDLKPDATPPASGEAGAVVCGACGDAWTGQKCGQAENGHSFPVCYPVATPPAASGNTEAANV